MPLRAAPAPNSVAAGVNHDLAFSHRSDLAVVGGPEAAIRILMARASGSVVEARGSFCPKSASGP